jgi:hypothetical protein
MTAVIVYSREIETYAHIAQEFHRSYIFNSQKVEIPQMFIDRGIDKHF